MLLTPSRFHLRSVPALGIIFCLPMLPQSGPLQRFAGESSYIQIIRPDAAPELAVPVHETLAFAAGLDTPLNRYLEALGDRSSIKSLSLLRGADRDWTLARLHADPGLVGTIGFEDSSRDPRWMRLDSARAVGADGTILPALAEMAEPSALDEAIDLLMPLGPRNGGSLIAWGVLSGSELRRTFQGDGPHPVWSSNGPLSRIERVTFSASAIGDSAIRFRMLTDFASQKDALVLADELSLSLSSISQGGGSGFQKVAEGATVAIESGRITLQMELSVKEFEALRTSETARKFLHWKTNEQQRESRQKVEEIFQAMGVRPGGRVADLGAGGGFLTVRLARAVGSRGKVWPVDISSRALKNLEKRAEFYPQIEVVRGEVDDPGLPVNALDAVVIVNAYHEMEEYEETLGHVLASLKPGGYFVLVEPWSPGNRQAAREAQVKDHNIAPEIVEEELRRAGFEILDRQDEFITGPDQWLIRARRPEGSF